MKKRFIAVLLAAAAGACVFAGCGTKQSETKTKNLEPDTLIRREMPNVPDTGRRFDGIMPAPPEHGITRPAPLPAPHRHRGFNLK